MANNRVYQEAKLTEVIQIKVTPFQKNAFRSKGSMSKFLRLAIDTYLRSTVAETDEEIIQKTLSKIKEDHEQAEDSGNDALP